MNMGWKYLTPEQAFRGRGGRTSNVLLETNFEGSKSSSSTPLKYKRHRSSFFCANVNNDYLLAIIVDLPVQDGFIAANKPL